MPSSLQLSRQPDVKETACFAGECVCRQFLRSRQPLAAISRVTGLKLFFAATSLLLNVILPLVKHHRKEKHIVHNKSQAW